MKCKRCGTELKWKYTIKNRKIAKALVDVGIYSDGKVYWCPKCYPKKGEEK